MLKNNKGYSFVETITVIVMIGILLCFIIPLISFAFDGTDILKNIVNKRDIYIYYTGKDEDKAEQAYNYFLDYSTKNIDILVNNSKNAINSYIDLLDKLTEEEIELLKQQGYIFNDNNDDDFENIILLLNGDY
ncbi:hypothetical protein [Tissierella sp.]|uniref:pilus assembly FimT family protein n=1 Tax=Tissierella sp. TaxID=41274 RepID=UPI00302939E8